METDSPFTYHGLPRDLILLVVFANVATLVILLGMGDVVVRGILALPLALIVPGYAVCVAVSPRRLPDPVEAGALSLGLSLVITILGGLLLNLTPWGISTRGEALYLWAVTLAAICAVLFRAWEEVRRERAHPRLRSSSAGVVSLVHHESGSAEEPARARLQRLLSERERVATYLQAQAKALSVRAFTWAAALHGPTMARRALRALRGSEGRFALALLLVIGAATIAVRSAEQQATVGVTQFWALPPTDAAHPDQIQVGIENVGNTGATPITYRLVASVGDRYYGLPSITLGANQSWKSTIDVPHWATGTAPVYIFLYRAGDTTQPYRELTLWPAVTASTPAPAKSVPSATSTMTTSHK